MTENVRSVPVTQAEYVKFCYLIKVMDALDRTHIKALTWLEDLRQSEGTRGYMDFDWRGVIQFIQPQLQVVFLQDADRRPENQRFMRFPFAAIVARTAMIVELDQVFELEPEGFDSHPGVDEVANAFRTLEAAIQSLGGRRQEDGMKTANQLKRVLRLEL